MASPPKTPTVTEFLYFRLKPSVKPEDADNLEGEHFLNLLRKTTLESGHLSSAWGRTEEDTNNVIWVIEWADSSSAANVTLLQPFIDTASSFAEGEDGPKITTVFTTLTPPISTTETLSKNPTTELVTLAVPTSISIEEQKKWHVDLINFRSGLMKRLEPEEARALSWSAGNIERPATFDHDQSPSKEAFVYLSAVGWPSRKHHLQARESQVFAETIAPLREKMIKPVKGLEMRHVKFNKIEKAALS